MKFDHFIGCRWRPEVCDKRLPLSFKIEQPRFDAAVATMSAIVSMMFVIWAPVETCNAFSTSRCRCPAFALRHFCSA